MLRTVQMTSAVLAFVLLLAWAAAVWDGPSALIRTAAEWTAGQPLLASFVHEATDLHPVQSGTCDDDAALFAGCEVPVAEPLERAVPAILESTDIIQSATFAENPNTTGTDQPFRPCLGMTHAYSTNDAKNYLTPTDASCCVKVEYPAGAGLTAPRASGCSCDPQECKCA